MLLIGSIAMATWLFLVGGRKYLSFGLETRDTLC